MHFCCTVQYCRSMSARQPHNDTTVDVIYPLSSEIVQTSRESWEEMGPTIRHHESENRELSKIMGALETGKGLRINNRRGNSSR